MLKKHIFPLSILILSIAGILLSYALAEEFYFMDLPQYNGHRAGIFTSFSAQVCGEAESFFSCENVSKSKYAILFGFPMALFGLLFYLITLFTALAAWFGRESIRQPLAVALFWTTASGLFIDAVLFYISFVQINALCPLCLFTYAVNFLLFGLTLFYTIKSNINPLRLSRIFKPAGSAFNKRSATTSAVLFILMILAAGGLTYATNHYLIRSKEAYIATHKRDEMRSLVAAFLAQPPVSIQLPALSVHGDPDAPVTIIEISDFLCPYCSHTSRLIDELIKINSKILRVLFVNFPLDKSCNRYMRATMHRGACELAKGAVCAAAQEKLHPYQSAAFAARKNNPTKNDLDQIVASAGLDQTTFNQCLEDPGTSQTLQWQIDAVQKHGIHSTPTLFINGKRYKGKIYKEVLQQIIDLEAK